MKFSGSLFFLHEIFKCSKQSFKEQNKFCKVCSCKKFDVAERGYHKSVLHLSNFCDTIVVAMKSKYARFVVLNTYDFLTLCNQFTLLNVSHKKKVK